MTPTNFKYARIMEAQLTTTFLNLILCCSIAGLFIYIKWYFSILSSSVKNRLHRSELLLTIFGAVILFLIVSNKSIPLSYRYSFFIGITLFYFAINFILFKHLQYLQRKGKVFPKSYLIYHEGKFYRGPINQNKLSEEDIVSTLNLKGVNDLTQVDSIILETNGELTIIYKEKVDGSSS
jgi:uncharacterized membrane protein YcaP (DUF421 family)